MNKNELDRLFDDALNRSDNDKGLSDPYRLGPLASDHFLLQKSWTYFKKRVQEIEQHYSDIIKARDLRVRSLEGELKKLREHNHADHIEKTDIDRVKLNLIESQAQEWIKAREKHNSLTRVWQEERMALEEKCNALYAQLDTKENRMTQLKLDMQHKEQAYLLELKRLREEKEQWLEEKLHLKNQHNQEQAKLESREGSWVAKVDLLRAELDERLQTAQELTNLIHDKERAIQDLESQLSSARLAINERDKSIHLLEEEKQIREKEIESVRKSWQTEQAQWRELWEQVRGFLESKRDIEQRG